MTAALDPLSWSAGSVARAISRMKELTLKLHYSSILKRLVLMSTRPHLGSVIL